MQKTSIEYLTHTWNPIAMRCTPCSPGCENCWHLRTAGRLSNNPGIPEDERKALAGEGPCVFRQREIDEPARAREGSVIGVQFMGDLFHDSVPDAYIEAVFEVMYWERRKTFLLLTKRPQRMADIVRRLEAGKLCSYYAGDESGAEQVTKSFAEVWPHVWLGLTICNQSEADVKIPELLRMPGKKFISYEPALGPVDFTRCLPHRWKCSGCGYRTNENIGRCKGYCQDPSGKSCDAVPCPKCGKLHYWTGSMASIDLIIAGGETGPGARPMDPDWVRSARDQCQAAGVPYFFKQWGEYYNPLIDDPMSPDGQVCRICGCTWNSPCNEGCYWVEDNLCSACVGKAENRRYLPGGYFRIGSRKTGRLLDEQEYDELPWAKGRMN